MEHEKQSVWKTLSPEEKRDEICRSVVLGGAAIAGLGALAAAQYGAPLVVARVGVGIAILGVTGRFVVYLFKARPEDVEER